MLAVTYERLMYRKDAVEVDPNRCSDESVAKNTKILHQLTEELIDKILSSHEEIPRSLGILFAMIQDIVQQKYPHVLSTMSGGFFFLRFLSPVALSPYANGLLDTEISASCRRTMILITKILQSISNGTAFSKEEYMIPFNNLISSKQSALSNFLFNLRNYCDMADDPNSNVSECVSKKKKYKYLKTLI